MPHRYPYWPIKFRPLQASKEPLEYEQLPGFLQISNMAIVIESKDYARINFLFNRDSLLIQPVFPDGPPSETVWFFDITAQYLGYFIAFNG